MKREDYRETVEKMDASLSKRSGREEEIEACLNCSMPRLLRRLMDENDGQARPALRDLNSRLDDEDMSANVSPNTFYKWLDKYGHR